MDWGKGMSSLSRSLSGVGQTINTVNGFITQMKDGTLNLTSILTILPSLIFGITSALRGFADAAKYLTLSIPELAIIVAIIGAIAFAIKQASDAYNADAIASKKAAKAARELADSYNKVKEAAESLKTTITDYNDGIDAMKKLSAGTEEYEEALNKANKAAEELIEKYPEIEWSYNSLTGAIDISKEALEKAERDSKNNLSQKETASKIAQMVANELQAKSNRTNLLRSDDKSRLEWALAAGGIGAIGGAAAGSVTGIAAIPLGVLGAIAGSGAGFFGANALNDSQNSK